MQVLLNIRKLPVKYWSHELLQDLVSASLLPLVSTGNRRALIRSVP
jgi:hypothetical protein